MTVIPHKLESSNMSSRAKVTSSAEEFLAHGRPQWISAEWFAHLMLRPQLSLPVQTLREHVLGQVAHWELNEGVSFTVGGHYDILSHVEPKFQIPIIATPCSWLVRLFKPLRNVFCCTYLQRRSSTECGSSSVLKSIGFYIHSDQEGLMFTVPGDIFPNQKYELVLQRFPTRRTLSFDAIVLRGFLNHLYSSFNRTDHLFISVRTVETP